MHYKQNNKESKEEEFREIKGGRSFVPSFLKVAAKNANLAVKDDDQFLGTKEFITVCLNLESHSEKQLFVGLIYLYHHTCFTMTSFN